MNKIQAKRLLNVAKALRESAQPELFTMQMFVWGEPGGADEFCGTPACALGHFAARRDLQKLLKIQVSDDDKKDEYACVRYVSCGSRTFFDDEILREYFGIDYNENNQLFSVDGCNKAKTPKAAADYIEKFVKTKMAAAEAR